MADDEVDLTDAIRESAQAPLSATNDQGSYSQHSLSEQIKADQHVKGSDAVRRQPARGLRFNKLIPPGTI